MDPRAPHIQPVAMTPASGVVPAATNLVDPRPPLKVEKEKVHDFEVHREGGYAKGHTRPSKEVSAMPTDAVAIGAQPHGVVPGAPAVADARILPGTAGTIPGGAAYAVDPRPPLKVEKEKVHDFEAHREGAYVKGHTVPGAKATGEGLANVPGGPAGHALPGTGTTTQKY